jgi:hypothetical protein
VPGPFKRDSTLGEGAGVENRCQYFRAFGKPFNVGLLFGFSPATTKSLNFSDLLPWLDARSNCIKTHHLNTSTSYVTAAAAAAGLRNLRKFNGLLWVCV